MAQLVMIDQVLVAERDADNPLHHQGANLMLDMIGGFNRSSQHRLHTAQRGTARELLWTFSIRAFCVVGCSRRKRRHPVRRRNGFPGQYLSGSAVVVSRWCSRSSHAATQADAQVNAIFFGRIVRMRVDQR